jgi:hypothetical protein
MESQASYSTDTTVASSLYDDYVGRYEYPQGAILIVTKEDDRLFAQLTNQQKHEIFPSSENEFYWKVVDAQIKFVRNEKGIVDHAVHNQGGGTIKAPKLEDEKEIYIDPTIYDTYVGEYDLEIGLTLKVTKEDTQLFAQLTGQPKFEIFPRSETEFFWKVVKAHVVFVKDNNGDVTGLVLHQGGRELEGKRNK